MIDESSINQTEEKKISSKESFRIDFSFIKVSTFGEETLIIDYLMIAEPQSKFKVTFHSLKHLVPKFVLKGLQLFLN